MKNWRAWSPPGRSRCLRSCGRARYYARAYRLAWAMTGRREAAEELTQEIFLRAWQKAGQFRGESSFGTWFYRLATHCCLNFRKRLPACGYEPLDAIEHLPQTDTMKQIEADVRRREIQEKCNARCSA